MSWFILMVPEIEAGNILFKQLTLFSGACNADIVMGAQVPIILTSRSDNAAARMCAASRGIMKRSVHAAGYCLGGTLLSIAAAAMARDGDDRLKSVTLFAAQTDFEEAGELLMFIDESQLSWLEDGMWEKGYLDSQDMAGTFQMLHSRDLVLSPMIEEYMVGDPRRQPIHDQCRMV